MGRFVAFVLALIVSQAFALDSAQGSFVASSSNTNKALIAGFNYPNEMESALLNLDVQYDISVAERDFESMSKHLREIGLLYFNVGSLRIAEGYVWRSKIVAEENDLLMQDLYSCALLSKINFKLGNHRAAVRFEEEYLAILASVSIQSINEAAQTELIPESVTSSPNDLSSENSAEFPMSVVYTVLGLVVLLVGIHKYPQVRSSKKVGLEVVKEVKEKLEPNKLLDIDINLESLNLIDFFDEEFIDDGVDLVDKEEETKKTDEITLKDVSQEVVIAEIPIIQNVEETIALVQKPEPVVKEVSNPKVEKGVPITESSILQARQNSFFERSNTQKLPLWVSGLEHYFKNVNLLNGIRFDFNYTGNFSSVQKNDHITLTNFLKSFTDELVDGENVSSVSAMLVNTDTGLVMQLVVKPIDSRYPVISSQVTSFFSNSLSSESGFYVSFSENTMGNFKMVLKSNDRKEILES